MRKELLERFPQVRPATVVQPISDTHVMAVHITEERHGICPFLGLDDRCTIYHDRPEVCHIFGSEIAITMTCSYQSKDGRIRSRQERRDIERKQADAHHRSLR